MNKQIKPSIKHCYVFYPSGKLYTIKYVPLLDKIVQKGLISKRTQSGIADEEPFKTKSLVFQYSDGFQSYLLTLPWSQTGYCSDHDYIIVAPRVEVSMGRLELLQIDNRPYYSSFFVQEPMTTKLMRN